MIALWPFSHIQQTGFCSCKMGIIIALIPSRVVVRETGLNICRSHGIFPGTESVLGHCQLTSSLSLFFTLFRKSLPLYGPAFSCLENESNGVDKNLKKVFTLKKTCDSMTVMTLAVLQQEARLEKVTGASVRQGDMVLKYESPLHPGHMLGPLLVSQKGHLHFVSFPVTK